MTVTSSSPSYRSNITYYSKSNNLTSTKMVNPAASSISRSHTYCVFSPPELVHDDEEEDEEDPTPLPASPPTTPPSCLILNQHRILKNSIPASPIIKRRKCIPHRSPSSTCTSSNDWIFSWPSPTTTTGSAFASPQLSMPAIPRHEQQYQNYSYHPRIVHLRKRINPIPVLNLPVSLESSSSSSSSSSLPNQSKFSMTEAARTTDEQPISTTTEILSPGSSSTSTPIPTSQSIVHKPLPQSPPLIVPFHQNNSIYADMNAHTSTANPTPAAFSSGRPTRLKGPCQACHENSEACMRKAFNWPFPSDEVYYDKGRPFVYLCNKCGLRYNKSGGSVCRQCRWVLCKEEKRKVIQLIEAMRSSRSDGQISLDEDIASFVCTPKYWNCGQPWKIRWAVNDLVNIDDKQ